MMPVRHQVLLRLLLACALPLLAAPGHAAAQFTLDHSRRRADRPRLCRRRQ